VLRLIGFFVLALVLLQFMQEIPFLGGIFRIPFVGLWIVFILLSVGSAKLAAYLLDRRKLTALQTSLGATNTPYNKGKLGSLLLAQKRYRRAIPLLEVAAGGESDSAEWHYRLGAARLGAGSLEAAIESLERSLAIDEEHAYGSVLLRLAEARARAGQAEESLERLERFERNHGPNPESAYRRGLALRSLKRGSEARAAFDEVSQLASRLAKFQRKGSHVWTLKAAIARLG
jgi:tetratricopeptide (TPR) repeat protein